MVLKPIHLNLDHELVKWIKIYCIKKNNKLNPSKLINELMLKFREENS